MGEPSASTTTTSRSSSPRVMTRVMYRGVPAVVQYDTGSLGATVGGGPAVGAPRATGVVDGSGPAFPTLPGSPEGAPPPCARPADLRVAPATVGRPVIGVQVR